MTIATNAWPGADLPPRLYLPFSDGRYTVTARMRALGTEPHFQIDARYPEYIAGKLANHRRARDSYYLLADLSPALERAVLDFTAPTLADRYPAAFACETTDTRVRLENRLLGLVLTFDRESRRVVEVARQAPLIAELEQALAGIEFLGMAAFEALPLQLQEDWAAVARDPASAADRTAALHVSFPSHWRPIDKIGRSFVEVHRPVPGIEPLSKAAPSLIDMMITKGPWERFTWTLPRTPDLDEHLDVVAARPHPGVPTLATVGERAWLRVERQVVQGFPAADGALFMIRLHIVPLAQVAADPQTAAALASAVRSKWPEARTYKQLADWDGVLLAYLDAAADRDHAAT